MCLHIEIWIDEPVPNRHLFIHEQSQTYDLCPYPCPYSFDQLQPAPENTPTPHYEGNIFDFPDVMTTTCIEDTPGLDDVLDFEYGQKLG